MTPGQLTLGYIVSDNFTFSSSSTVTGFDFYTWSYPGDSIDWSIAAQENGGTVYGSGTSSLANTIVSTNGYGYQINFDTVSGLNVPLAYGHRYWLNLQNAVTAQGNPLYWDENSGKSQASENSIGTIGSEAFDILGGGTTTTSGATPEPASIMLLGSGILGLAGVLRRKLF